MGVVPTLSHWIVARPGRTAQVRGTVMGYAALTLYQDGKCIGTFRALSAPACWAKARRALGV